MSTTAEAEGQTTNINATLLAAAAPSSAAFCIVLHSVFCIMSATAKGAPKLINILQPKLQTWTLNLMWCTLCTNLIALVNIDAALLAASLAVGTLTHCICSASEVVK